MVGNVRFELLFSAPNGVCNQETLHSRIKLVAPLGVEPSYSVLQTDASTVVARVPLK